MTDLHSDRGASAERAEAAAIAPGPTQANSTAFSAAAIERAAKVLYYETLVDPFRADDSDWEKFGGKEGYRSVVREMLAAAANEDEGGEARDLQRGRSLEP